ncbi:hypothetical protein [Cesiribacter andamanensis]|uniref:PsbP C-terminal domain-containing protein n=1 Tax=Cesiribacter andamanensis AMV16 TaxID=1279009 RepID=M7N8A6_9BACT|nr:hypothetical protein [Cesiribacter andamanensis]EMR03446.1 hypothetical protein ADICEAN_01379 [Cesiribacter andamanensis AMV16]
MNKLRIFLLGSLLCCVLDTNGQVVSNKDTTFSVVAPADWRAEVSKAEIVLISAKSGFLDPYQENVRVLASNSYGWDIDRAFRSFVKEAFPDMIPGYKQLQEGTDTLAGLPAKWLIFQSEEQGYRLESLVIMVVDDTQAYAIVASALAKDYPRYSDTFKEIASSFSLLK